MRKAAHYSSHLPVVWYALECTCGAVLELGAGMFSTPFLHWYCVPRHRLLVTVEQSPKYYQSVLSFEHAFHRVLLTETWDDPQLEREWDVVFIDHSPPERRRVDLLKYAELARYIIVHDTNRGEKLYRLRELWPCFRHVLHYNYHENGYGEYVPSTTIVSNFEEIGRIC